MWPGFGLLGSVVGVFRQVLRDRKDGANQRGVGVVSGLDAPRVRRRRRLVFGLLLVHQVMPAADVPICQCWRPYSAQVQTKRLEFRQQAGIGSGFACFALIDAQ